MDTSNRQKAVALVTMIATDDAETLSYIDPAEFVQHDLSLADGLEGYKQWLTQKSPAATVEVIRVLEEQDRVIIHLLYDLGEPKAVFDIYRFKDGRVVEHWNNFQDFAGPNPSGRTSRRSD